MDWPYWLSALALPERFIWRATLDAYGRDEEFAATVSEIDPAETVREGVATYKVILNFDAPDDRIRVGMSANVDIETAKRAGVFAVPARAVISKNGNKILRILRDSGGYRRTRRPNRSPRFRRPYRNHLRSFRRRKGNNLFAG